MPKHPSTEWHLVLTFHYPTITLVAWLNLEPTAMQPPPLVSPGLCPVTSTGYHPFDIGCSPGSYLGHVNQKIGHWCYPPPVQVATVPGLVTMA
jgi:hypothetical protein